MIGEWVELSEYVAWRWDLAEIARLNRTADETADLHRKLARQRVRHILNRLCRG